MQPVKGMFYVYQMLIVDDNNKDRRVLREIINWSSYDIEIIGEAANGREALKQVEVHRPDIIITDIYMPVVNGLDLVAEVRKSYAEVKIIFMSFYEDFEFAKSAIDLSVYGYIVKPIRKPEVEQAISKVLSVYKKEEESEEEKSRLSLHLEEAMPILKESFFRDMLFGVYGSEEEILKRMEYFYITRFQNPSIRVFTILVKNASVSISVAQQYSTAYSIKELLTVNSNTALVHVVQTSTDEYTILNISDKEDKSGSDEDEINYIMDIYPRLDAILNNDFVIGISMHSQHMTDIHTMFKQARKAAAATFYSRKIPVVFYRDIIDSSSEQDASHIYFDEMYSRIDELLMENDDREIWNYLKNQFTSAWNDEQYIRYQAFSIVNILQINILEHRKNFKDIVDDDIVIWKKLNNINTIPELIKWLYKITLSVKQSLYGYAKSRNGQIVESIKRIIHEKYAEQIGINEIVQTIYMSSKQANNIFKKETGQSIFEYLVSYRIRVAKELLLQPDARISETAYRVGYVNSSHFSLLFKRITGKTPREFQIQDEGKE